MLQRLTRATQREYNEKRRIAKKMCKYKKKEAINKRLQYINKQHAMHAIREISALNLTEELINLDCIT